MDKFINAYKELITQVSLWDNIKSKVKSGISHLTGQGGNRKRTRDKLIKEFIKAYDFQLVEKSKYTKKFGVKKAVYICNLTVLTSSNSKVESGKYQGQSPDSANFFFKFEIINEKTKKKITQKYIKLRYNYSLSNVTEQVDDLVLAPLSLDLSALKNTIEPEDQENNDEQFNDYDLGEDSKQQKETSRKSTEIQRTGQQVRRAPNNNTRNVLLKYNEQGQSESIKNAAKTGDSKNTKTDQSQQKQTETKKQEAPQKKLTWGKLSKAQRAKRFSKAFNKLNEQQQKFLQDSIDD